MNLMDDRLIELSGGQARDEQRPADIPAPSETSPVNFQDILKKMVNEVQILQENAGQSITGLTGNQQAAAQNMTAKMEQADQVYDLMMKIRHKLNDAYGKISDRIAQ